MNLIGNIQEVTVPITYNYIEAQAFTECVGLEKVVFSDQYTEPLDFFSFAFYNCKSLKEVVMPNVLANTQWTNNKDYYLPGCLFEKCSKLTKVTFPDNLTVEEIDMEKMRVRVVVSMFGRETPIELELDEIETVEK